MPVRPQAVEIEEVVLVFARVLVENVGVGRVVVFDVGDVWRLRHRPQRPHVALEPRVQLARLRPLDAGRKRVVRDFALRLRAGGHVVHVVAGFGENLAYLHLGFVVLALSEVAVANLAVVVYQILGGPVAVVEGAPRAEVVVLDDGILQPEIARRLDDVLVNLLELELRRVDAENHQAALGVFVVPRFHVGQRADAVYAGVRPEIHQNDLAFVPHPRERERRGVYPLARLAQFGGGYVLDFGGGGRRDGRRRRSGRGGGIRRGFGRGRRRGGGLGRRRGVVRRRRRRRRFSRSAGGGDHGERGDHRRNGGAKGEITHETHPSRKTWGLASAASRPSRNPFYAKFDAARTRYDSRGRDSARILADDSGGKRARARAARPQSAAPAFVCKPAR